MGFDQTLGGGVEDEWDLRPRVKGGEEREETGQQQLGLRGAKYFRTWNWLERVAGMSECICVCVCVYVCVCACVYMCVCVCVYLKHSHLFSHTYYTLKL